MVDSGKVLEIKRKSNDTLNIESSMLGPANSLGSQSDPLR